MAIRNWKDIPLFKDVTDEQWNDWHWQVANRLSTVEEIAQVVNLTEKEKEDIEKVMGGFRVGITPYYASLMDPDDPRDPVRMQAVPTLLEMHRSEADDMDPLHEDADSPAPGLTHRYPDRVLFLITDQCSMYCRHCTRRRLAGETDGARSREDIDACIEYIRKTPQVRDVLLSGGDALCVEDETLEYIISELKDRSRRDRKTWFQNTGRYADENHRRSGKHAEEVSPDLAEYTLQPPEGTDSDCSGSFEKAC